ncbi:MAG: polymerase subunit alpha, partial [Dehalococcoidia bacterium]|nr:polymerase subunit alpha [Dehalococcoidia bacterium]
MPDIDMDFQDDRRDEVMNWVVQQYGADKVAQIVTFGTMGAKAVLRDVGRVQGLSYGDVDAIARLIPAGYRKAEKGQIKAWTIEDALELIPEFKQRYDSDYAIKGLIDLGKKLEGSIRNTGTHAAGVVISDEPLANYVPLQRPLKDNGNGIALTQFPMEAIAQLGLLKMDFLGLVNLTILQKCRALIAQTRGLDVQLLQIPLDDKTTYDVLSSGDTSGIFQLESAGMRRYIKELKPTSLGDLSAMIALYRPGPLEQIPAFIDSKHGRRPVVYPHPILKELLQETYGIIVYQDQVLLVLQQFAGYSLGQADIVRKAMGKKIAELMQAERGKFLEGAKKKGFDEKTARNVWELIEPFAGYAFNKAHSVSYALIAYWTAYFKANYPSEYMAALLTCFQDVTDKVAVTVAECQRLGIPVLPPDINHSEVDFTVEASPVARHGDMRAPAGIRFGLGAIKNVGPAAVEPLLNEVRDNGPFQSINDFCRRSTAAGLNRRTLECLIKVGALDSLNANRATLLNGVDHIIAVANQQARQKQSGQVSLFDLPGLTDGAGLPEVRVDLEKLDEADATQRALWEK